MRLRCGSVALSCSSAEGGKVFDFVIELFTGVHAICWFGKGAPRIFFLCSFLLDSHERGIGAFLQARHLYTTGLREVSLPENLTISCFILRNS